MAANQTVSIRILDKEYQVTCPPEEIDALQKAARQLDTRMASIRNSGTVIGLERIAVMAALNLVYDLEKAQLGISENASFGKDLQRISDKVNQALQSLEQTSAF